MSNTIKRTVAALAFSGFALVAGSGVILPTTTPFGPNSPG
ncbi:hypothetical protein C8E05_6027 [Rhodococcus wratislaviensis]|uniref:Uncharacterized protein n=1 Tax=Rhodococcus wratislaviensis TaxID=44752 RepID=A0AB38F886_RHOWR|nr:hypothetical protein C8E05_6027 [Rhodococcus wratislaviensis]SPZ36197.1 Uncharacterised protein [Rhodococcus wratislaviensis]